VLGIQQPFHVLSQEGKFGTMHLSLLARFEKIANATGNNIAASAMPTGIFDRSAAT